MIKTSLMLLSGIFVMAACSDDRDGNPTISVPASFNMNVPSFAASQPDLKDTATYEFTWDKADFGYSAKVNYTIEVSNTGKFTASYAAEEADASGTVVADYDELSTIYNTNKAVISNDDLALALVKAGHWEKPENVPATQKVYVRIKAALQNVDSLHSNVVEFTVKPKYMELPPRIENCYFTGSKVGWGNWKEMIPVYGTIGKGVKGVPTFWMLRYFEANEAFKFAPEKAWGKDFGYNNSKVTDNVKAGLAADADGNIQVAKAGWYLVVVGNDGKNRTVSFEKPNVYLQGPTIGNWNCEDKNLFKVAETADGEFVSPTFVASGEFRVCVKISGYDWWKSEFNVYDGKIVYRGTGGDQARVDGVAGQQCYLNFTNGTGSFK